MCIKINTKASILKRQSIYQSIQQNQIVGFQCSSTCEDLYIDVSITTVGLVLTKQGLFLSSGYWGTDMISESSYWDMSAHKKFKLRAQN